MGGSLELVFQYFFTAGAGIGLGILVSAVMPVIVYRHIMGKASGKYTKR